MDNKKLDCLIYKMIMFGKMQTYLRYYNRKYSNLKPFMAP